MTIFQLVRQKSTHLNKKQFSLNLLLLGSWLWLYSGIFPYLSIISTREDFRTNQIIFVGLLFLLIQRFLNSEQKIKLDAPPQANHLPLFLIVTGSVLYLLIERYLDINTLAATCFGLATYGLIGLWQPAMAWRKGFTVALLFIATLPFGEHMQTFIGYPMRILTAKIVQDGLQIAGVASVGIDTILVFENGVSHIDLPCSGVRSLWTGAIFLLGATWIEKRAINVWWWLTAVFFTILLFLANLTRVALLIITGEVMGWRFLAELIHVPLGVLGFVVACAVAVYLLRVGSKFGKQPAQSTHHETRITAPSRQPHFTLALIAVTAVFALLYTPRPQTGLAGRVATNWTFPATVAVEHSPLTAVENEWFTKDGAESAERYRFSSGNLSGSMILISSKTWRAHHRPERCFEVYGLTLNDSSTHLVSQAQPIRTVLLGNGTSENLYTASYWFQSAEQTTDDYGTRIWSDLSLESERWVLVSIIFDETVDLNSTEVTTFYEQMHSIVDQFLLNA